MLHVATIIAGLNRGGAEQGLLRLVAQTANDVNHTIISLSSADAMSSEFRALGAQVLNAQFGGNGFSISGMAKLAIMISKIKPDLLIGRMYHGALAATFGQLVSPKIPLVWTLHHTLGELSSESASTRRGVRLCKMVSNRADAIVYVSKRSQLDHDALGFCSKGARFIPNGYDTETVRLNHQARATLRSAWGFSPDDVIVGLVARHHPMKDHGNFLTALAKAHSRNPRLAGVICGANTENISIPEALRSRIVLLGERKDAIDVISACDIGVMSSAYGEAFPNAVAEFLACERPCVVTNVGDAADIVLGYGSVVPPRNSEALSQSLCHLAGLSASDRIEIGQSARRSIIERFSMASIASQHLKLWASLVHSES